MTKTSYHNYDLPEDGGDTDIWGGILNTALKEIDKDIIRKGPIGSRPAAGSAGRWYLSTDETTLSLYYDDGTAWQVVWDGNAEHATTADSLSGGDTIAEINKNETITANWTFDGAHQTVQDMHFVSSVTELDNAIGSVSTAGSGIIFVAPGTYTISATKSIPANTVLRGAGPNATEFVLANSANVNALEVAAGDNNVVITGVKASGNSANNTSGVGIKLNGAVRNVKVADVWVTDFVNDGIEVATSTGNADFCTFTDVRIDGCGGKGCDFVALTHSHIVSAKIENCTTDGVVDAVGHNTYENVHVTGCRNGLNFASGASDVNVSSSHLYQNGQSGVLVAGSHIDMHQVLVEENSQSAGGSYAGITLSDATNCNVLGGRGWDNQTTATQKAAVEETGTSPADNFVTAMRASGNSSTDFSLTGTGSVVNRRKEFFARDGSLALTGNLNFGGYSASNINAINAGDTDLALVTNGGGSSTVTIRDAANTNASVARFSEGGAVDFPNGPVTASAGVTSGADVDAGANRFVGSHGHIGIGDGTYLNFDAPTTDFRFNTGTTDLFWIRNNGNAELPNGGFTQGVNPADVITETTSPKSFNFNGGEHRDIHTNTDVTISNGTTASATETITVELYDGIDTTGTLVASESQSVTVAAGASTVVTFLAPNEPLDTGTYHIEITQSGTTLSIDQTDEYTAGAAYTLDQDATGKLQVTDQAGDLLVSVDPISNTVTTYNTLISDVPSGKSSFVATVPDASEPGKYVIDNPDLTTNRYVTLTSRDSEQYTVEATDDIDGAFGNRTKLFAVDANSNFAAQGSVSAFGSQPAVVDSGSAQREVYESSTEPTSWTDGDIWLEPQ